MLLLMLLDCLICQHSYRYLSTMPLLIAFAKYARTSPTRRSLGINSILLYIMADNLIVMLSSFENKMQYQQMAEHVGGLRTLAPENLNYQS